MKYSYAFILLFFIVGKGSCCYYSSSKSSCSRDNSRASDSSQIVRQSQQNIADQKLRSFAYSKQFFNHLDISSQQLAYTVVHKLQTVSDAHDYALYLGIFKALEIAAFAQQKPMHMNQILNAAYQNQHIQQQQTKFIKNALDTSFAEQNNDTSCKQAQAMSNALIRIMGGFAEQMSQAASRNEAELTTGGAHTCQFPGLQQIKEFVTKFGELSTPGKKVVGNMLIAGNISEALKLISVGEKGIHIYDRTRQNTIEGTNPTEDTERKPFVEDPKAGIWREACISGDVILQKDRGKRIYLSMRDFWHKDPKCPFNVLSHGNPHRVSVETEKIHEGALDETKLDILKNEGIVQLNAEGLAQLIRTHPEYKGQHIHLFGCECGGDPEGIAQQLSDEMQVTVSAFTTTSWSSSMSHVFGRFAAISFENWLPEWGEIKTFHPREMPNPNFEHNRIEEHHFDLYFD